MSHWAGRLLVACAVWTAVGALFGVPMLSSSGWRMSLWSALAQWWSWGAVTPFIVALDRRLPYAANDLRRRLCALLAASLLFTAVYYYLFTAVRAAMGVVRWDDLRASHVFTMGTLGWYLWSWLICCVIVGGLQAYRYYQRYVASELRLERLERNLSQARLNALRMQLDPHFLFNALNTISAVVERDPKLTRRMIEHLGDLLRMSLENKDRQEAPLSEELAFLDHYLAIQKIRFGSKLNVEIDVAPEVRYALVPTLIVQPLVENAIRHGISRRASGGTVRVTAGPVDGHLEIRVKDDGLGLPPGWSLEASAGLGLAVTRDRIAGLHPGASLFAVRSCKDSGGVEVQIVLPLRLDEEEMAHDHAVA